MQSLGANLKNMLISKQGSVKIVFVVDIEPNSKMAALDSVGKQQNLIENVLNEW
jgi:hypothetical protein